MDNIFDHYNQTASDFEDSLNERSTDEINYDKAVLKELNKGRPLKRALKIAARKHPNEALEFNNETREDIEAYYDYLINHELIKNKIEGIK